MDVDIKVSLRGGHVWEFTCDEDDPIVLGLVSALPGASIDSVLPPDGLIQIESRKGERMFLTRSSLVAVTVSRREPSGPDPEIAETSRRPSLGSAVVPASFVLFPEFLEKETIGALIALAGVEDTAEPAGDRLRELRLERLPAAVANHLTGSIDDAWRTIGRAGDHDSHLDVKVFLGHSSLTGFPQPTATDQDILHFLFHLPVLDGGLNHVGIFLDDRQAEKNDPELSRRVVLKANSLLVWQASTGCGQVALDWRAGGSALLVSGALRRGGGDGQG